MFEEQNKLCNNNFVFQTTVVTTRRILERLAVCYVSQRTAWKLVKGASFKLIN